MGRHPWPEGITDRFARASLRLVLDGERRGLAWTLLDAEAGHEHWPQDVYAEVLAVVAYPGYPKCIPTIRYLAKAELRISPGPLALQPIVWGHLLRRLISSDPEDALIQPLFHAIPSRYWRADYVPPPIFSARNGLKICLPSHLRDGAVSLLSAIDSYLYPYVADAIYQRFRGTTDIADPTDEFPAPPDPRLHMLLTMAASRSVHRVAVADPSIDSLFIMVIRHIGMYMGVSSLRLYNDPVLGGNMPSFELDPNRHAVLKVLYPLVSSYEFGDTWMRSKDQCIALLLFLQTLESTSRPPQFLPEDWCTPVMASNFVWIAFQDHPLTSQHEDSLAHDASAELQLILYFFQFAPVINEAFAYVVSERLLESITSLRGAVLRLILQRWDRSRVSLQTVLGAFITGLKSDALDRGIFHWAGVYLFQLANLLAVWVIYVLCDEPYYLRRLALLHRDDLNAAWSEYLKDLDTVAEDFRAFVDGSCVGDYGLSPEAGPTVPLQISPLETQALDEDQPTVGSLRGFWQRLRRHPDIESQIKVSL
ncbi:uncharacterized protein EV420DRAFT_861672 [Desarmillaria tabescens]|uniref:Uncharacterized protein n=1 Tax=Armillaria tabescens TaxID=1929756 RepID=A0AA39MVY6_ARMTA|nr:uncharacterized protein EV420DRAFT_861672 [Desarmillaria tabescens]KAK0447830.1 hypothetical protein EV420DRAFT_861672 [Desarmillaria tabescens]